MLRLFAALLVLLLAPTAAQAAPSPKPTPDVACAAGSIVSQTGTCTGTTSTTTGGNGGGGGNDGGGGGGGAAAPTGPYEQTRYREMCTGDAAGSTEDTQCTAPELLCPDAPPEVRPVWVETRIYDPGLPESQQPPFVNQGVACVAPADLPTPDDAAVIVQRDFRDYVVVEGTTRIDPGAATLVNVDTIFSTDRTGPVTLDPFPVLGFQVVLTLRPVRYDWHFGDGTTLSTTTPGRPREKVVTHVYERPGDVNAHVVIHWAGTFTVAGGPERQVQGTATTTGPATPLAVRSARSELVKR